jgi:hypothetical protein
MKNVKKVAIVFFCMCSTLLGIAQNKQADASSKNELKSAKRQRVNELYKMEEEGESGFNKHSIFHIKANTDGWGIGWELGKVKTAFKSTLYQIEFSERKHKKEEKQTRTNGVLVFGNPFIYGKENNFYQFKLGIGQQWMIGGKGNKNGVAAYGLATGGISAALLRPYYMDVEFPTNSGKTVQIKYSQADSARFMGPNIIGGSGISKGWNEMKVVPGIYAKTAVRFDWGRFNSTVSAIETGFNFEYYTSGIHQMVGVTPNKLFVNGYISLLFGNRK